MKIHRRNGAWDRRMEGSGLDKAPLREWRDLIDKEGFNEMRCSDGWWDIAVKRVARYEMCHRASA